MRAEDTQPARFEWSVGTTAIALLMLSAPALLSTGCNGGCDGVRSDLHHCGAPTNLVEDGEDGCECAATCIEDATCADMRANDGANPVVDCIAECPDS